MLAVKLPRYMPPLSLMLDDIGNPKPADLARQLGVSKSSVYRWIAADDAPRPVMLALFWITRWGAGEVECRAVNDAMLQAALARNHRELAEARLREVQHLLRVGDFGGANSPLIGHDGPLPPMKNAAEAEAPRRAAM